MNYLLICFYFFFASPLHIGHVAEYYYQLDGKQLNLKFMIEKEELMSFDLGDCDVRQMTALCAAQYVNKHAFIKINGKDQKFELQNSFVENGHLVVNLSSVVDDDVIRDVNVVNKCFYEFNRRFKNRIIFDIAQFQNSYLLNRKRSEIKLN